LAGLAVALRLGEAGYEVELFERRSVLGGRASSFVPPGETQPIDNCQHVLLGCCTNLLDFFRRAGVAECFRFYNRFVFVGRGSRESESPEISCSLSASALPAPLHLLPSLLGFRILSWKDRVAVGRALWSILRTPQPVPDEPLMEWLERHQQSAAARENFWRVILTSALNEELERLSTRSAFHVFVDSFLRNRRGYRMGIPTVPLGDLYSPRAFGERCTVHLSSAVARLQIVDNRVQALCLHDGRVRSAEWFVSALPADSLANLISEEQRRLWPALERCSAVEWSPITGIHLWFDRPVMERHHVTVCGRTIQWVFNKSAIAGDRETTGTGSQYIQLVISASRSLTMLRREEILERVLEELAEIVPQTKGARLERAVVVRETNSTPSFPPGTEGQRPGPDTPLENLFLAGDWTASGWPPTMEGAVRSGYRAAARLTEAAGRPQRFLVPDLPSDFLARLLLRGKQG
jgi:zeta-carotene desaturase